MTDHAPYAELATLRREAANLQSVAALVAWDQETYMPPSGAAARAEQAGLIATLHHERLTNPRIGELIKACEADAELSDTSTVEGANLREMRRDFDRSVKLPADLVRALAETGSKAQHAWKAARADNDFATFAPLLSEMIELTKQKAQAFGIPEHADGTPAELYDALIDEYEPDTPAATIAQVFAPLKERLSAFIKDIADNGAPPETAVLDRQIPEAAQHALGLEVLAAMGFDLDAGRLDTTTHPFCEGLGPGDTRLTTRYRESRFTDALYGTLHEMGHGLYEQGLPKADSEFGLPSSESISLGIHESQSRLWENFVGRSEAFWTWALPLASKHFGDALSNQTPQTMAAAVNTATPSFIRVESDEGTYNLHVMLRFEIERALIAGDLAVKDLPGEWNTRFERDFGMAVPDDTRGCLQDVHWSFGLFGYFPTYTLGNLYAAQLWQAANTAMPDLDSQIARGEFSGLLTWLQQNIHAHGRRYPAAELAQRATGQPLSADPLMSHLESRIRPAYGLS